MKKIINGKLYNTDTARQVGYVSNGSTSNFEYWCETLYQKRTGEYFLHCEGGPLTKYGVKNGNSSGWGYHIKPLTYDMAKAWAEKSLDADEYQREFGDVSEDDDDVSLSFKVPADVASKIEREAAMRGTSKTALLIELINKI